ncbi:MAG: hypothetical protein RIQ83_1711, partial [Pseudomonadota bacterium]
PFLLVVQRVTYRHTLLNSYMQASDESQEKSIKMPT